MRYIASLIASLFVFGCTVPPAEVEEFVILRSEFPHGLFPNENAEAGDGFDILFRAENQGPVIVIADTGCVAPNMDSLESYVQETGECDEEEQPVPLSVEAFKTFRVRAENGSAYLIHILALDEESMTVQTLLLYNPSA